MRPVVDVSRLEEVFVVLAPDIYPDRIPKEIIPSPIVEKKVGSNP